MPRPNGNPCFESIDCCQEISIMLEFFRIIHSFSWYGINVHRTSPSSKLLTFLILLYGGMLVYASLMPFDFTGGAGRLPLGHSVFSYWPFNPRARISGSDFLSNLVLYTPWGFLLATRSLFRGRSRLWSLCSAVLACSLLSMGVEFLQSLTISRTPSASDWLLNTMSGLTGAVVGVFRGTTLWEQSYEWLRQRWRNRPLDIGTLTVMALLAADALSPFLPTILLSQVWRNIKRSHFSLTEGIAQHPWHWWLITRVLVYLTLTFLLVAWNRDESGRRRWLKGMFQAMAFALALELVKPMIVSRAVNLANVATSAAGAAFAAVIGPRFVDRLSQQQKLNISLLALLSYLLYLAWTPFDFTLDPDQLRKKIPSLTQLLPLYHYAMGATLNHLRLFVQNIALSGLLICLLRVRFAWFDKSRFRLPAAITVGALLAILLEGGQLFLPTRTPSMTDIYCFMFGSFLGAILAPTATMETPTESGSPHD
jgi:VanZ family protein